MIEKGVLLPTLPPVVLVVLKAPAFKLLPQKITALNLPTLQHGVAGATVAAVEFNYDVEPAVQLSNIHITMGTINVKDFSKKEVKVNLNGVIFTAKEYEVEQQDGSITTATRRNAIIRKAGYNVANGVAFEGGDVVISKSDFDAALIAVAPMQLLEKARIKKSLTDELGADFVTDEIVDEMFYNNFVAVIEFEPMLAGKFTGYDGTEKNREHDYIKTTLVRIERKTK